MDDGEIRYHKQVSNVSGGRIPFASSIPLAFSEGYEGMNSCWLPLRGMGEFGDCSPDDEEELCPPPSYDGCLLILDEGGEK